LGFALGTPRNAERRGHHVTLRRADAAKLVERLAAEGVVGDFRTPDGVRMGFSPLTTRFADVHDGLRALATIA
ncbi:MAG TPA: hypothetical protein VGS21_06570, partial [Acidimicrobiales bacterium]|nr:hypothetical protein [Acidimicrobiales bacterium]